MNSFSPRAELERRLNALKVTNFTARELLMSRRWGRELNENDGLTLETCLNLADVAELAQAIRSAYGKPVRIISGYRSPALNVEVGGARASRHLRGMALDLAPVDTADLPQFVRIVESVGRGWKSPVGMGVYSTFVHVDTGDRARFTRFQ